MSVADYSAEQVRHFEQKAKHNKRESLWCFRLIMLSTLTAPLLVSLGEGLWFGKVVPSILSALAAFCTAWIQLRKPQELWSIYRGAQRQIELQITHYEFSIGEFKNCDENEKDKLLAYNVSKITLDTHELWRNRVPEPSTIELER